jgi:hypothetical protein
MHTTNFIDMEVKRLCLYFPKLDLRIPRENSRKEDEGLIEKVPRRRKIVVCGATLCYQYENQEEGYYCLSLEKKTVYFHYSKGINGEHYLNRVSIPCFG